MAHRQRELRQQLARMGADDRGAEDAVLARHRQHLHEARACAIDDRAVELGQVVAQNLMRDAAGARLALVQSDPRDLGIGKGHGRHHGIIRARPMERGKQRGEHRRGRLMPRGMGELVGAGHIAAGEDVGVQRPQPRVGPDRLRGRDLDAKRLKPISGGARPAPDGHQQRVERFHDLGTLMRDPHRPAAGGRLDRDRRMVRQHAHPVRGHPRGNEGRDLVILAHQQARRLLDDGDAAAKLGERLRHLAADRPAAEHQQARREGAQLPQRLGGEKCGLRETRQIGHDRLRPGGDDDRAGGDRGAIHLNAPGRGDARVPAADIDAEGGVPLERNMRRDGVDHGLHARHHRGEIDRERRS